MFVPSRHPLPGGLTRTGERHKHLRVISLGFTELLMSDPHANSLFINPEEGVHDGCFLITPKRCPIKLAEYRAMIESLGNPSQKFLEMTKRMAAIKEVKPKGTKEGDAVSTSSSSKP